MADTSEMVGDFILNTMPELDKNGNRHTINHGKKITHY